MMNEEPSFSYELRRYVGLFWHWAWLLGLAMVLIALVTYIFSKRTTPVYQADALVLVNEAPATRSLDTSILNASTQLAQTYAQVMTTRPVLEGVAQRLGWGKSYSAYLQKNITVQPVKDTQLIKISVQDTNPQRAADIANTLVVVFAEQNQADQTSRYTATKQNLETQMAQVKQQIDATNVSLNNLGTDPSNKSERDQINATLALYQQTYGNLLQSYEQVRLAETQSVSNIVQKEPAVAPTIPVRPRVLATTIQGAFVGLLLAAGLIFLIEILDDTIKDPEEITQRLGLSLIGLIAKHESEEKLPITVARPRSPVAEAFRSLRTNLQYTSVDHPIHTLLVTSPSPGDGKSTVAANLGVIIAQGGKQVVLLDADLRKPKQHKLMGLNNRAGISEIFTYPQIILNGNIQKTEIENLSALTSGKLPPNPSELLGSEKMVQILDEMRKQADMTIIDSPPVLAVTDAVVLSQRVDGVMIVIKPGATKFQALKQTVDQLQRVGANIVGIVLNDVELKRSAYKYAFYKGYYYSYHHYYEDEEERGKKRKNTASPEI
jgi:capsular exopolysaccharide synthesis family protein